MRNLLFGLWCGAVSAVALQAQDTVSIQDTAFVVRDSAGIRVAESSAPLWTPETAWRLSDEPTVRFGGDREPGDPFLFRVSAARRLPDGGFLLANNRTDLRRYDANGRLVWSTLVVDENPRPVQPIASIDLRAGDSIGVFNLKTSNDDESRARYTIYAADGRLGRVVTIQSDENEVWRPAGALPDGSILAVVVLDPPPFEGAGRQRPSDTFVRSDLSSSTLDTLGAFDGAEVFQVMGEMGLPMREIPPFQHTRWEAVRDTGFLTVFTESFEVREHDATGTLRGIVRRPFVQRPVSQADIDGWRSQKAIERRTDDIAMMTFPATHPALDRLLVDADGNVWIRHIRLAEGSGPFEWTVFGRDGRWLGSTWTPEHLSVLEIGSDYVLGMWREPEMAQSLELYPLIKP